MAILSLVNPKRNGVQLSGTYQFDNSLVYFMYGNGSKTTFETPIGTWYVPVAISTYNSTFYQLTCSSIFYGKRTLNVNGLSTYFSRDYFLMGYATLDNSDSVNIPYTAPLDTVNGILKVTHNVSGVELYKNAGYATDDFSSPDLVFDNLNLTQSCTKSIITGYMGLIDVSIKLEDNLLAVTTDTLQITLGGGVPATVVFDWGRVTLSGTNGVGSVKPLLSVRAGEDTIVQSNTNRTTIYNPKRTIVKSSVPKWVEARANFTPIKIWIQ